MAKISNSIKLIIKKMLFYPKKLYRFILFYVKYYPKMSKINMRIIQNNKKSIIPVLIDCELPILNQYIEPVLEEFAKKTEQKFEYYFGETIKGAGSSYFCYNPKNVFPVEIYEKLKGNMLFLSPHIYPKGPSDALKVILDHAICSAKFSFHPKNFYENYDIYCVTGKLNEAKIAKTINKFGLQDKIKIVNIGYPKSDKLFQGKLPPRNEVFSKLELDSSNTTIVYSPSWEKGLSMREFGFELATTIIQNKKLNLIVKPHPANLLNEPFYNGGVNWTEKFMPLAANNSNCSFIKEFNIEELLIISDIMITDISSVSLEFLALDKPVIYLDCPKFEETFNGLYKTFNDISYEQLLNDPACNGGRHVGLINYDYKTILDDIDFLINNPDYKIKERSEFSKIILSNKGNASKICAKTILEHFIKREFT